MLTIRHLAYLITQVTSFMLSKLSKYLQSNFVVEQPAEQSTVKGRPGQS
jgi:hypothetical protein